MYICVLCTRVSIRWLSSFTVVPSLKLLFWCSDIVYWVLSRSVTVVCDASGCISIYIWYGLCDHITKHCSNVLYPFVRAKPDRVPLSALGIHHKAPACHSSVQSGSVLFYHKLFPYASSHRGLMTVRRLRDRQVSCLPQPPLSVKSADSTEAVTLVMEGLLGRRTCVQQPCGVRWTTGAVWPTMLRYFTSNVSVSLSV